MKKIIIAEDDPAIRDTCRMILERAGYHVTMLSNGDTLLNGHYEIPDIFVLDKQLSGVDGLDICRYLKQQETTRHIPVIMLSASPQISRLAELAGASGWLEKPFKMQALRDMVAKHTG